MHLYNRGTSYYVVVNVPRKLIPLYRKKQIWISLQTKDKKIANVRSIMIVSRLERQFLIERQNMTVFSTPDKRLRVFLNDAPTQSSKQYDDYDIKSFALDYCIEKAETDFPNLPKTLGTVQHYIRLHDQYVLSYQNNDFHLMKDDVDNFINNHKLPKPTEECFTDFFKYFMLAYIQYTELAVNYLQNAEIKPPLSLLTDVYFFEQSIPTSSPQFVPFIPQQNEFYKKPNLTLSDLVRIYNDELSRQDVSQVQKDKINQRVDRLSLLVNNKKIRDITADDLQGIVSSIRFLPSRLNKNITAANIKKYIEHGKRHPNECISDKTAADYIQNLKTLFAWALKRKYIKENPIDEIDIPVFETSKASAKYQSFTVQQLQKIFHSEFYSKHWDNNKQKRDFFWIGLLGLYTGARLNEICQLQFDDIQEEEGIKFISINDNNGKHVKTKAGIRKIPIHNEPVKLGFLNFVRLMQKQSHGKNNRIFTDLVPNTRGELSAQPSKWFGKLLDSIGLKEKGLVFHSFRHTVRTILRNNNCPIDRVQRLCGWEGANSLSEHYGTISIKVLANELNEKLVYEGLLLPILVLWHAVSFLQQYFFHHNLPYA